MCFPFDAIVPDIPEGFQVIAGGAAGEHLTLTSGRRHATFSAYLARAEGPTGVVVLPDVRGLFRFYEQLAERFAAAGHPAIAIDYFGRTAGLGPRDESFEYMPHVKQSTPENVARDVETALDTLREETGASARSPSASASAARSRSCRPPRAMPGWPAWSASTARSSARGSAGRSTARRRRRSRCSACSRAPTRTSRPTRSRRSTRAAGGARDPHLRGRAALLLRPPPGALQSGIPGRVGTHPEVRAL